MDIDFSYNMIPRPPLGVGPSDLRRVFIHHRTMRSSSIQQRQRRCEDAKQESYRIQQRSLRILTAKKAALTSPKERGLRIHSSGAGAQKELGDCGDRRCIEARHPPAGAVIDVQEWAGSRRGKPMTSHLPPVSLGQTSCFMRSKCRPVTHPHGTTMAADAPLQHHPESASSSGVVSVTFRVVQQIEEDFLSLSYGGSHISKSFLESEPPDHVFEVGGSRTATCRELLHVLNKADEPTNMSFTDFVEMALQISQRDAVRVVRRFSRQLGWTCGLTSTCARLVHLSYLSSTNQETTPFQINDLKLLAKSTHRVSPVSEEGIQRIFQDADIDGDGVLSKSEFAYLFLDSSTRLLFSGLDQLGNESCSRSLFIPRLFKSMN